MFDLAPLYVPYLRHPDPPTEVFDSATSAANGQIVGYTGTDPTSDGVKPSDLNSPAIAVKPGNNTYTWDTTLHIWV